MTCGKCLEEEALMEERAQMREVLSDLASAIRELRGFVKRDDQQ